MARSYVKPLAGLLLLLVCSIVVFWTPARPPLTFKEDLLYIRSGSKMWPVTVELAETPEQQRQGLMHRRELETNRGMLFVNREPQIMRMWMKDTPISLDMLFIDESGNVVAIVQEATPYSTDVITYEEPVSAVLELPGGTVRQRDIEVGSAIIHSLFRPYLRYK